MVKIKNEDIKIEISEQEILKRIDQIEKLPIEDDLRDFMISALQALVKLDKLVGMKETTLNRLRKIFNKKLEKNPNSAQEPNTSPPKKGHNNGKNGKDDYPAADKIFYPLDEIKKGELCPECQHGTLQKYDPGIYIRITGSPLLEATIHETEKLRCSGCLKIFEARCPIKGQEKYDERAKALVALLKYRANIPFYRLEKIQGQLFTPLPASTQWDLTKVLAEYLMPVWRAMINAAAEAQDFAIDDTTAKVISLMKENKVGGSARKGIYTTGIMAHRDFARIHLYFTGRKHAGENLTAILDQRNSIYPPIVMSDALGANNIKLHNVIKSLCLVHGRRQFIDLENCFDETTKKVLDIIGQVYKVEKESKDQELRPKERLLLHKEKSGPAMAELKEWLDKMVNDKMVEPNSSLGNSINYMRKHWQGLTSFLRIEGATLDNNLLEESLRVQVLNRKNWLFYRTLQGALVGDIIISLIKTCEANGKNPFEYLVWVQKAGKKEVEAKSKDFLPWLFN